MAQSKVGWFSTPGRPGDRTLKDQLTGLEKLIEAVPGKSVLDVGCAEGLISMQLFDEGAAAVHGLEIVKGHVDVANKMRGDRAVTFEVADVNTYTPVRQYDIVIMLAILQKLRNPSEAAKRFAAAAREMVVLRLPPEEAPFVVDARSGKVRHDIDAVMLREGWHRYWNTIGHFGEWMGYYGRHK